MVNVEATAALINPPVLVPTPVTNFIKFATNSLPKKDKPADPTSPLTID
ncbi:hypothetical protein [Bacillus sp. AFS096315]|nr:hypothetical protein [Bacillus sp. AFS096315]